MTRRLLIVDDKDTMRSMLTRLFSEKGYDVISAEDGRRALALLAVEPAFDVILSDIKMPAIDGLTLLDTVKTRNPDTEMILMTAYAEVGTAIRAMKAGAFDYLIKPFDPDEAELVVEKAMDISALRRKANRLQQELEQAVGYGSFIGDGEAIRKTYYLIDRAAQSDVTVLLTGESGTGKELAARTIHERGARKDGPFVTVNCGALPELLAESELFGHVKGAFTGAISDKAGLFEEANGGTVFLDEINSLPQSLQVKLNRAIEQREARRVGSTRTYTIDTRLIAAMNVDPQDAVASGRFREDLYFRLNVLQIRMPSLRERKEDIPALTRHFLQQFNGPGLSPDTLKTLLSFDWPGNVRQLRNTIERAVALCEGDLITQTHLPDDILAAPVNNVPADHLAVLTYQEACDLARSRMMTMYLTSLMREYTGNVTAAAEQAGIGRETLHRLLKKHNITPADFRK